MTRYRVLLGCMLALLCVSSGGATAQVITEFSAGITAGAFPWGIAAGSDGNVWFTEFLGHRIGKITPAGVVTQFSAGITGAPNFMHGGPDGNVWFTMGNRSIGRITPSGVVTEFTAGVSLNSSPHGITAGPDGNLWFTEQTGNRIGRITTSGAVTEFSTGISPGAQLSGITAGPDGNVWFTESLQRSWKNHSARRRHRI